MADITIGEQVRNLLIKTSVRLSGSIASMKLRSDAQRVRTVQRSLLKSILKNQTETGYGRHHRFSEIKSIEDYRKNVPINDYETLRAWIEAQDRSGRPEICADKVLYYAATSGTTGKPKYIPVTKSSYKSQAAIQKFFSYSLLLARPKIFDGHILAIVSPGVEGQMKDSGLTYGSTSGHMYLQAPAPLKKKYAVPYEVYTIDDYDLKYRTILRLAIQYRDLSYLTTANPSTLVQLARVLRHNWDQMMHDLRTGTFVDLGELNAEQQEAVQRKLVADAKRADELEKIRQIRGQIRYRDVWPNIQAVGCWQGGSCSIFYDLLEGEFDPDQTMFRDIGYLSSEFRGTIPISSKSNAGIPTFTSNYFEFVLRDEWDMGIENFVELDDLESGQQYYIFITTPTGLYRYNMNDVVEVEGYYYQLPLLRFVQKGKGATNITGEKLYENQVISAIQAGENLLGLKSEFYTVAADEQSATYLLFYEPSLPAWEKYPHMIEAFSASVDDKLSSINVEYQVKRKSGRLRPLEIRTLRPGTFDVYKRHCIGIGGRREGQFKIVALNYLRDLEMNFHPYVIDAAELADAAQGAVPGLAVAGVRTSRHLEVIRT